LRIKAGSDHTEWREELYNVWDEREGAEHRQRAKGPDSESEGDNATELQRARRRLMTDGQKFRQRLMRELFDSEMSGAVRRT
jgi:hypothetical protein